MRVPSRMGFGHALGFAAGALIMAACLTGTVLPPVAHAAPDAKADKAQRSSPFGNFGASKEPVRIDAASLQVIDKEQKAIYSGDVVAIQGQTTLRCSKLTVFYNQKKKEDGKAEPAGGAGSGSAIKKLVCDGPVSVVSDTQTATGDHGVFDADAETVTLSGNVVLADCENVQRGDKLVYNTRTGVANVTNNGNRRVQGVFTPGTEEKGSKDGAKDSGGAKKTGCKPSDKSGAPKPQTVKADTAKAERK